MKSWKLSLLAAAAMTAASMTAAKADVVIAVVGPMTGQYAAFGEQMKRGAEMVVKDLNAKGGVNGQKVKLIVGDDACDPKQAVAVANKLVSQRVAFVAGHFCSGSSIPASAVYAENGILQISPASTNPALTEAAAKKGVMTPRASSPASSLPRSSRARRSRSCMTRPPTAKGSRTRRARTCAPQV
jgi:branched-chain amino acid transport system substrate-binding protein